MTGSECPGEFMWSAFGAYYPDTVCATALKWEEGRHPGAVLCDADNDFYPSDISCPICDPVGFFEYRFGELYYPVCMFCGINQCVDNIRFVEEGDSLRYFVDCEDCGTVRRAIIRELS